MADQALMISVRADTSQLRGDLAIANAQVSAFGKELRAAAKDSLQTGDTTGVASLAGQFENAVTHAKSIKAEMALGSAEALTFSQSLKQGAQGLEQMAGQFRGGAGGFLGGGLGLSGGTLAIAATVGALGELFHLFTAAGERAHEVGALAAALGASTGEVKSWTDAARRGGVEAEVYGKNMERLAVNAEKAAEGLRKNVLEGAKLLAPTLIGEDASNVRRGGRSEKFAPPTNMVALAPDSAPLHKYVESVLEEYKKLNEGAAKVGQAPKTIPSFETALFQTRLAMAAGTDAAKKLNDEVSKFGGDVRFQTVGEGLDRLAPKWRDIFTKMNVELINTEGEMTKFAKVKDGFLSGLSQLPETERLGIKRTEFGRGGLEPLFGAAIQKEGERIHAGEPPAPAFDDPKVAALEGVKKAQIQARSTITEFIDSITGTLSIAIVDGFTKAKGEDSFVGAVADIGQLAGELVILGGSSTDAAALIKSAVESVASALGKLPGTKSQDGFPGGFAPIPGNAAGGLIRGPGTGTSDSILARLSNGEFVVPAHAASANLGLLNAMSGGFTPPGFALGGEVGFAAGGHMSAGGGGGSVTVNLVLGGENFSMVAPQHVADKLVIAARQSDILSAGKRPSWNGS
jgi:hypothetical protein